MAEILDNLEEFNDYEDSEVVLIYASFWKRVGAYILDRVIVGVPLRILGTFVVSAESLEGLIWFFFLSIIAAWLYFAIQESGIHQATLGKRALRIKVTDMDGEPISFGQASGRYFAKIISGIILLIGYVMAAFTDKNQALHDLIAGTLVVENED